jgi:hypothetical protein
MNRRSNPSSLADYWSGIHAALDGRLLSVQQYLRHPSSGFNAENYFRDLLRQYLPRRFSIESGFVVNATAERSDFLDALIVDCVHIPPLSAEPHFKVFPAEAVVGAIEITSAPKALVKRRGIEQNIAKLQDDILKLAKLREIAKDREYREFSYSLAPRSFLITCGDEWVKKDTYEKHLMAALADAQQRRSQVWVNAVFSMRHGMFHFKPHTAFEHEQPIRDNALLEFVLFLNNAISDFPVARIDLRKYRPTLPADPGKIVVTKRGTRLTRR